MCARRRWGTKEPCRVNTCPDLSSREVFDGGAILLCDAAKGFQVLSGWRAGVGLQPAHRVVFHAARCCFSFFLAVGYFPCGLSVDGMRVFCCKESLLQICKRFQGVGRRRELYEVNTSTSSPPGSPFLGVPAPVYVPPDDFFLLCGARVEQ